VIGEGGMGIVRRARDRQLDREVAVKFLKQSVTGTASGVGRFVHEMRRRSPGSCSTRAFPRCMSWAR
jgi:serine/threonine protein kinase